MYDRIKEKGVNVRNYCFPIKCIDSQNGNDPDNLLLKKPLQIGLSEKNLACFTNGGFVILDYGFEMNGGVRILTHIANNVPIRIRFGESLTECSAELGGKTNATNDHSLRDFTVNLQHYSDMTFGNTGFRFIRIDFFGEVKLKSIVAVNNILVKKSIYSYKGADSKIDAIFKVAKRTIDLCASGDYLWDGIKRDRLVWIGDIHPEMLALTTLYGRMPIIERSLDFIRKQTPLPKWMNGYPSYSMWWIIIVSDYCELTGTWNFAKKQVDYMQRLVTQMLDFVAIDGKMQYSRDFVDWQTKDKSDEKQGVRAINIIAAKKAIKFLEHFNENIANAQELLYRLTKKEIAVESSKSVLGLKYFATGLTANDEKKLIDGGVKGLSTFMSYYILTAVASFNKAKAIEMLKDYYGAMLDKGATTFWEDFNIDWSYNSCRIDECPKTGERDVHGDFGEYCYKGFRHSLCHGWASGIIRFIKEYC